MAFFVAGFAVSVPPQPPPTAALGGGGGGDLIGRWESDDSYGFYQSVLHLPTMQARPPMICPQYWRGRHTLSR